MEPVEATPADIEGILQLVNSDQTNLLPRTHKEIFRNIKNWVVVRLGEKIISCAAIEFHSKRFAEIRSVIVHPDYRGRDLAEKLVTTLMTKAKNVDYVIAVTNKPRFFSNLSRKNFGYGAPKKKVVMMKH